MTAHKDIRIPFQVGDRRYEAVGFLNEGEASVDGDEMFRRVPDAIGKEDARFLDDRRGQDWSRELSTCYLITNWRIPKSPHVVQSFHRRNVDSGWVRCCGAQYYRYGEGNLVLRRCA